MTIRAARSNSSLPSRLSVKEVTGKQRPASERLNVKERYFFLMWQDMMYRGSQGCRPGGDSLSTGPTVSPEEAGTSTAPVTACSHRPPPPGRLHWTVHPLTSQPAQPAGHPTTTSAPSGFPTTPAAPLTRPTPHITRTHPRRPAQPDAGHLRHPKDRTPPSGPSPRPGSRSPQTTPARPAHHRLVPLTTGRPLLPPQQPQAHPNHHPPDRTPTHHMTCKPLK